VEPSDARIIDNLLAGMAPLVLLTPAKAKLLPAARSKMPRKQCTCAICPQCLDNKRWELIFNAKFADPDYYRDRPVRHASSLELFR